MLKQRIITALILAPILLSVIIYGNQNLFAFAVMVIQSAAIFEWLKINKIKPALALINAIVLSIFTFFIADQLVIFDHMMPQFNHQMYLHVIMVVYTVIWMMALLWLQNYRWGYENTTSQIMIKSFFGVFAIMLFGLTINELYEFGEGRWLTLVLFFLIWVADIGAYMSGKTMGKHKLAPNISPGKTWEGVIGAQVLVALYAVIVAQFVDISWYKSLMIMVPVALFSVVGDLAASLGKRQADVKDSSNLLPGHGGFVDRFDSLIAATPMFFFLYVLL